jgi:hypothetical protein
VIAAVLFIFLVFSSLLGSAAEQACQKETA